jgi:hypothetical protein
MKTTKKILESWVKASFDVEFGVRDRPVGIDGGGMRTQKYGHNGGL